MIKRIKRHINGIKRYYHRDGFNGVLYYIKHRIHNRIFIPIRYSDIFIRLSPERCLAKRFEETLPVVNTENFSVMGNYWICNQNQFSQDSIVYSLGVLSDTDFDEAISNKFGCPIYLFDPSNIARDHLEKVNNPKFIFDQIGVWNETCDLEFSTPKYGGSPSMIFKRDGKQFVHRCVDLKEVMEQNGHQHIDVIKMDIEGAAFGVLNRMLELEVYPSQIIAEFERTNTGDILEYFKFYSDLMSLNDKMSELGYQIFVMPRDKYKYYSIELLYVRFNPGK